MFMFICKHNTTVSSLKRETASPPSLFTVELNYLWGYIKTVTEIENLSNNHVLA